MSQLVDNDGQFAGSLTWNGLRVGALVAVALWGLGVLLVSDAFDVGIGDGASMIVATVGDMLWRLLLIEVGIRIAQNLVSRGAQA